MDVKDPAIAYFQRRLASGVVLVDYYVEVFQRGKRRQRRGADLLEG